MMFIHKKYDANYCRWKIVESGIKTGRENFTNLYISCNLHIHRQLIYIETHLTNEEGEHKHSGEPVEGHEEPLPLIGRFGIIPDGCRCLCGEVEAEYIPEYIIALGRYS